MDELVKFLKLYGFKVIKKYSSSYHLMYEKYINIHLLNRTVYLNDKIYFITNKNEIVFFKNVIKRELRKNKYKQLFNGRT